MGFNVGAGVDYAFNDAWKLVTDVRFQTWSGDPKEEADGADTKLKLEDPSFGAYIGLQQNLTNASFAFGAMFGKRSMNIANSTGKADDFTFAVPLSMTVSF